MIQIKDTGVLANLLLVPYHPILIDILTWIFDKYQTNVITCGYRRNDAGVHGQLPCRGIDLRSSTYSAPRAVADDINSTWDYDPARPDMKVAMLHDVGQGMHIHLQVSDSTVFYEHGKDSDETLISKI